MPEKQTIKEAEELLRKRIRDIPDYPKPGILFKDITPLLKDASAFKSSIDALAAMVSGLDFAYIAGIEARGFIIGAALSYATGKGFVPVRKKGKLPYKTISMDYSLEYGTATIEMHADSLEKGSRVLVVDDLLATGGTARACADLIKGSGAEVAGYAFLISLKELNGKDRLNEGNVFCLAEY